MINELNFYFEISPKAELANDELGNPVECYCKCKINLSNNPIAESQFTITKKEQEKNMLTHIAAQFDIPVDFLKSISKEEYLENNDDDENDDDF